jgi:hypothetical protein
MVPRMDRLDMAFSRKVPTDPLGAPGRSHRLDRISRGGRLERVALTFYLSDADERATRLGSLLDRIKQGPDLLCLQPDGLVVGEVASRARARENCGDDCR